MWLDPVAVHCFSLMLWVDDSQLESSRSCLGIQQSLNLIPDAHIHSSEVWEGQAQHMQLCLQILDKQTITTAAAETLRVAALLLLDHTCSRVLVLRSCVLARSPLSLASSSSRVSKRYTKERLLCSRSSFAMATLSWDGGRLSQWLRYNPPFHANGLQNQRAVL